MTKMMRPHEEDVATLGALRDALRELRQARKLSAYRLSANVGRSDEFVSSLERALSYSPKMSSLQLWASGLDVRIEFGLEHFWLVPHAGSSEMLALYAMSRPWGADDHQRLWLVSALKAWRVNRGIDVAELAPGLGTDMDSVWRWEYESTDPFIARAMWQARLTGTRVTFTLWRKDEWIFG